MSEETKRDISTVNDKIARSTSYTPEQVAIVRNTIAKGTTDSELAFFLLQCKEQGLNPFNKEIWCYKDNRDNLLIFTGRDGMLAKAQKDPRFNGMRSGVVRSNDTYGIDIPNGKVTHVTSGSATERGGIVGAYAFVFMHNSGREMESSLVWCEWDQYNRNFGAWKTHPDAMIKKVAEAHALKRAMGFSGIEIDEDYFVKDGVATPFTPAPVVERDTEMDGLRKKVIEALDAYAGDDKEELRHQCHIAGVEGRFDKAFAEGMLSKLEQAQEA